MKRYAWGLLTGALLIACFMVVTATASPQDDSIKVYLEQLEQFLRDEMSRSTRAGSVSNLAPYRSVSLVTKVASMPCSCSRATKSRGSFCGSCILLVVIR